MRHFLVVGLVLAVVAPLSAQTVVEHMAAETWNPLVIPEDPGSAYNVNTHCLGWSGWNARSKPTIKGWGTTANGTAAAEFDKAELQAAIDAAGPGWSAEILVTQVNWIATPVPSAFVPVVGSADVGSSNGLFAWQGDGKNDHGILGDAAQQKTTTTPAQSSWLDHAGVAAGNFDACVTSGVASGASALSIGPAWSQSFAVETANDAWTVLIDATDVVAHYVDSDALLLFASGQGDLGVDVFGANQWGGAADIRVKITPEPVSLALLAMGGLVALRRRR